jgi:hypothetical protein
MDPVEDEPPVTTSVLPVDDGFKEGRGRQSWTKTSRFLGRECADSGFKGEGDHNTVGERDGVREDCGLVLVDGHIVGVGTVLRATGYQVDGVSVGYVSLVHTIIVCW